MSDTLPIGLLTLRLVDNAISAGGNGLIHVATNVRRAAQLGRLARQLAPDLDVAVLPPWDCLPYDRASPSREVMGRRMAALRMIGTRDCSRPLLLITTADAVIQRLPPAEAVAGAMLALSVGDTLNHEALEAFAVETGYVVDDRIDEPGEIALRGQVVEIFPAGDDQPVRIDIDGEQVVAIRRYDPVSQRTTNDVERIVLDPASEALLTGDPAPERFLGIEHRLPQIYARLVTLPDYLPKATISLGRKADVRRQAALEQIRDAYEARQAVVGADAGPRSPLAPDSLYMSSAEWDAAAGARHLTAFDSEKGEAVPRIATSRDPQRELRRYADAQLADGRRLVLAAANERDLRFLRRRVSRLLARTVEPAEDWQAVRTADPGALLGMALDIETGFASAAENVVVIAAPDLLGTRAGAAGSVSSVPTLLPEIGLQLGDAVIHVDHGMAVLEGLEEATVGGQTQELVRLGYAGGSHRLVSTDELDRIWRYGAEADAVSLDRLDGGSWDKRRVEIEAAIAETARQLVRLAQEREQARAPVLEPDPTQFERFVSRFTFAETADQVHAIDAVLADLRSGRPMDRLVCGDVGFGKTEVALRAAAAAVFAGKQVAIVAPTTVLARQHLQTFRRRFKGFGIEIAGLSRLVAAAGARKAKAGLADGSIQIVIGTHAIAAKGVAFADLGLLVIDEEQRFGAAHKARLRALGQDVHVLTLTATPIPRTLQAALVGLQQVSILATPPTVRQPIRTMLSPFDDATVRIALLRERAQGGQSFVVVPRVEDMGPMAERLRQLVPELDIRQAHGQMPAEEIDTTMVAFADGEGDVLLATSIIESGLDVPCANTMLVWRADRFGLAQLHQLRGRVGRGRRRGQVHLLTDPEQPIGEPTRKRLSTLIALDRLGAGFAIAARDLDMRGAGDLLGEQQVGHVKLIGADLYQHLLGQALRAARGEMVDDWTPVLNVETSGSIPADYVPEPEVRIDLYARLARAAEVGTVDALAEEIEDRFGMLPPAVADLLSLARLRALAREAGVAKVDAGPAAIALSFHDEQPGVVASRLDACALPLQQKGDRLILQQQTEPGSGRLDLVECTLRELAT